MIPVLYAANETSFITNGIGALSDATKCECTEVLNGSYELYLEIPVFGKHAMEITVNRIIKALANYSDEPQPFRVYSVEKSLNGLLVVQASHLSYDTAGIPVLPFSTDNLQAAVDNLNYNRNVTEESPFELTCNFDAEGEMKVTVPKSFRALLGDGDDTLLGIYGGDYHYDYYSIELLQFRGVERGVCFRAGRNLVEFEQEVNSEEMYSSIFGYWRGSDDEIVYSDIYKVESTVPFEKTLILEVSSNDLGLSNKQKATVTKLNNYIEDYIDVNNIGRPKYSMLITYSDDNRIIEVNLGDIVGVSIPDYMIDSVARCNKVVFNTLLERNESIEIGDVNSGIAGEIVDASEAAANSANVEVSYDITKSDIGLGNVDNTSDATKKSNFTGSIMSGDTGFVTGDDVYTALSNIAKDFTQSTASSTWNIVHNMNKYPNVVIIDSSGSEVVGSIHYVDTNSLVCTFSKPISGKAYLN